MTTISRSPKNSKSSTRTQKSRPKDAVGHREQPNLTGPAGLKDRQRDEITAGRTPRSSDRKRKAQISDIEVTAPEDNSTSVKRRKDKQSKHSATKFEQIAKEDAVTASKKFTKRTVVKEDEEVGLENISSSPKWKKTNARQEEKEEVHRDGGRKIKRKRKTQEEKEAEAMPLAIRSKGLRMFIGRLFFLGIWHLNGDCGIYCA